MPDGIPFAPRIMDDEMEVIGNDGLKKDFHHPYTPYAIQEEFMRTVYDVLEKGDGGVGILESPTGTVRLLPSRSRGDFSNRGWLC